MHHHSCRYLHVGLAATMLACAFGCNSHLLVPSGDPKVVIIDPPPIEQSPLGLLDGGEYVPPVTVEPLPDGAIPDTADVVSAPDTATRSDIGPDTVASPDIAPGAEPGPDAAVAKDLAPDIGPDAGPDLGKDARIIPDTNCPTPVPPINFPENPTCQGTEGGLGEAFQKALWFLNVNKSGPGVVNTYVQWRGDAHVMDQHIKLDPNAATGVDLSQAFITKYKSILDPDGNGEVDLSGGFHDAGDFIKFGLTTGFTGSTLAWSMYEFPNGYRDAGLEEEAFNLLRWTDDYFLKSTFLDSSGNVVAFAHQVSDQTDHACFWMPPELRRISFCPRKGYFATDDKPASDEVASAAAALAVSSLVISGKDAAYAEKSLKYAIALYKFAAKYPDEVGSDTGGLYTSEYAYDDLAWAALWLYLATGTQSYLDDILGPNAGGGGWLDHFPGFITTCLQRTGASCWAESATHDWNSVRTGVFLKLAQILRDLGHPAAAGVLSIAREDSMKWPDGPERKVAMTPAGFSVAYAYGSARYNSAGQFVALVYAKLFGANAPDDVSKIQSWAKRQMAYILGDNPLKTSYMMGYSDKYCMQPHHAAGHASIWGEPDNPVENRHIIWGALVNGPDADDNHVDRRSDFGSNEVTIDYNVSLIAALAAHYELWGKGQCPLAVFPPLEPDWDEFYTLSNFNSTNNCHSQVSVTLVNESVHVPRYDKHLMIRYFFDISEILAKGGSIADVTATMPYDRGDGEWKQPTTLSQPKPCPKDPKIYFIEMGFEGYEFWGRMPIIGGPRQFMIEIGVNNTSSCTWDASNDWSYKDLKAPPADQNDQPRTPNIPVYSSGLRASGKEPPTCFESETPLACPR
jgi:endoglucanase